MLSREILRPSESRSKSVNRSLSSRPVLCVQVAKVLLVVASAAVTASLITVFVAIVN